MKKIQIRLTLDDEMGPFFKWLASLPQKVRAREFIAAARTGYGVVYGVRVPGDVPARLDAATPIAASAPAETTQTRAPARKAAVETFGSSFLVATPPIQ